MKKNKIFLSLIGIIAMGAFLRLYRINFQSLWTEEIQAILFTDPKSHILTIIDISRSYGSSAFYILFYFIFKIFSYDDIVGRLACAIIGTMAIPVFYFLGKEIDKPETGLFAATICAINYYLIYFSQEFNFYSLAFLFTSLSYLFFIRAYKYSKERDFLGYLVSTILLLKAHSFGLLILATQLITLAGIHWFYKIDKQQFSGFVLSVVCIAIFAPWTHVLVNDLFIGYEWMQQPKLHFILAYFYNYTGKDIVITLIFAGFIFLFIRSVIKLEKSELQTKALYLMLILWLFIPYALTFIKSFFGNSILDIRFTIIFLPAWLVIISVGWGKLRKEKWKLISAACIIVSSMVNLFFIKNHYFSLQKPQLREASEFVKINNEANLPLYSSLAREFNFYYINTKTTVNPIDSLPNSSANLPNNQKVWLLEGEANPDNIQIPPGFELLQKYPFYKANVLLIEKKQ